MKFCIELGEMLFAVPGGVQAIFRKVHARATEEPHRIFLPRRTFFFLVFFFQTIFNPFEHFLKKEKNHKLN